MATSASVPAETPNEAESTAVVTDVDDPEMSKLRDIIRKLEQTQSMLTKPSDASPTSITSFDSQLGAQSHGTTATTESGNSPQRNVANSTNPSQPNGLARQTSVNRGSKQVSRKGSRGGSPSRDQNAVNRSVSHSSRDQYSDDDDDFEFDENEAAANADDESWILGSSKAIAGPEKKNATESASDAAVQKSSQIAKDPNSDVVRNGDSINVSDKQTTNGERESTMDELRRRAMEQEAEMRRETLQSRRTDAGTADATVVSPQSPSDVQLRQPRPANTAELSVPSRGVTSNRLDVPAVHRSQLVGSGTNLSAGPAVAVSGSAASLNTSASYQQLHHTPHGSVSSINQRPLSTALPQGSNSNLLPAGNGVQPRTSVGGLSSQSRTQSVTRASVTDLRAELKTVVDPARIFDASEKLELQKAQSSTGLNKAGASVRRPATATTNRNTSLVGRASAGASARPASVSVKRVGGNLPSARLSLSMADQAAMLMPNDQIDLNSYSEVAASAPSIPGATMGRSSQLAAAQQRGIAASSGRVSGAPVSLARAVGATGRPAVQPVGSTIQRTASQPLRNGAQPGRRPSTQLSVTSLTSRSGAGPVPLSARSGAVSRSSSATPINRVAGAAAPRTVSASLQRGGVAGRVVTPLSARSGPTALVRGARPATAPGARPATIQRGAGPRTSTPLTRGGMVQSGVVRGVAPIGRPGTVGARQPVPIGRPVPRAAVPIGARVPIPAGTASRTAGGPPRGPVPVGVRPALPRGAVPLGAGVRVAAPARAGVAQPRGTVPLTQRALEQHTLAMAIVGPPAPVGLLMVAGDQSVPTTLNVPRQSVRVSQAEDESWKEDCF